MKLQLFRHGNLELDSLRRGACQQNVVHESRPDGLTTQQFLFALSHSLFSSAVRHVLRAPESQVRRRYPLHRVMGVEPQQRRRIHR